ncbi:MAG: SDR family NAD(P)-dependent oxidoreductase [Planctomycetota bacterium]
MTNPQHENYLDDDLFAKELSRPLHRPNGWLVVGVSRGPARAAALALAARKQRLVLVGEEPKFLRDAAAEAKRLGAPQVDLIDNGLDAGPSDAESVLKRTAELITIEGLVCGLGGDEARVAPRPVVKILPDRLEQVFNRRVVATLVLLRQVGEEFATSSRSGIKGKVLLLSSMLGFRAQKGRSSACLVAAWLNSLGQSLAEEWRRDNIRLTTLCLPAPDERTGNVDLRDDYLSVVERGFKGLKAGRALVFPSRKLAREARRSERAGGI